MRISRSATSGEAELLFRDKIEGDLFAQVDRAMDLLYTKYTRGLVSYDGIYRVETFPVPREAMREALINAVIHRDYASPTTIQIRVCDDRIAIWNAARLKPEWTAELQASETSSQPYNSARRTCLLPGGHDRGVGTRHPSDREHLPRGGEPGSEMAG